MSDPRPRRTTTARAGAALLGATALLLPVPAAAHAAAGSPDAGRVAVTGDPLVHVFDLGTPGDAVTGLWRVTSAAPEATTYDGVLTADDALPGALAHALVVQYGEPGTDGEVLAWHDAGTLARPRSLADALPTSTTVSAARPVDVPVRVALHDPAAVGGRPGDVHRVTATFTVSYLEPGPGGAGRPAPTDRGVLATTGPAGWLALVAAALIVTGVVKRRRA